MFTLNSSMSKKSTLFIKIKQKPPPKKKDTKIADIKTLTWVVTRNIVCLSAIFWIFSPNICCCSDNKTM